MGYHIFQGNIRMRTHIVACLLVITFLSACGGAATATPALTVAATPTLMATPLSTETPIPTQEPLTSYPPEGYGPGGFPANVDPLTGLFVADPAILARRPLAVKISNLPRYVRPQWGLSLADIVFEYYTEEGSTRFIGLFYGRDAEIAGPIRSARYMDVHVIRGYKAAFAYGSADRLYDNALYNTEFADRLVLEWSPNSPLYRFDPNGYNHLVVDTASLSEYISSVGVENGRQNLDGMFFLLETPAGGMGGTMLTLRYSSAIYNRWEYDTAMGKYIRYAETADDFSGTGEQYTLQTDRLSGETLAFDNVVLLVVPHIYVMDEVWDIQLVGSNNAYIFRDGQVYAVRWQRTSPDGVVTLLTSDGTPFPFKPGTTWFEVIGQYSTIEQDEMNWNVTHLMP